MPPWRAGCRSRRLGGWAAGSRVVDHSGQVWHDRLNTAYGEFLHAHGRKPERGPERDLVRRNVATEPFRQTHEREPAADVQLKAFVARVAKPPRQPDTGVDLVFTPRPPAEHHLGNTTPSRKPLQYKANRSQDHTSGETSAAGRRGPVVGSNASLAWLASWS